VLPQSEIRQAGHQLSGVPTICNGFRVVPIHTPNETDASSKEKSHEDLPTSGRSWQHGRRAPLTLATLACFRVGVLVVTPFDLDRARGTS